AQVAQRAFAVRPALAHLDIDLQVHRLVEQLGNVLARLGGDALHVRPAGAQQDGPVAVALDHDTGGHAGVLVGFFPLLDDNRTAIGQFVAHQPEDLLAQQLGGDETHRPVRQRVFLEQRLALGQAAGDLVEQLTELLVLDGADRHHGIIGMLGDDPGDERIELIAALERVDLADHQDGPARLGQQRQQLGIAVGPLARLDHMHHHVHLGQRLRDHAVHHAVHGAAMTRLEARRVDEHELLVLPRQHAMDAMPRGLRFARHDGDLRADQGVGERRLADIGTADHGNEAGPERGIAHLTSWATATGSDSCAVLRALPDLRAARLAGLMVWAASSASLAADCSAARRLAPGATTLISSAGMAHSTSNCWLCAAPWVATTVYSGSASLRPCRNSCNRVLASLPSVLGSTLASTGWYWRTMTLRAASKPASRKVAPK